MTFSIVGCDLERADWGVAVASKFPSVGSVAPWARAGVGAVATQSFANTDYGREGLALMAEGRSASAALDALIAADEGRAQRQAGIVDDSGSAATFTGEGCMAWAGGVAAQGFACQGNILAGPQVIEAMAEAYRAAAGELVDRLLAALVAGEAAGGDRRGKQSAAVLVVREGGGYGGRNDRYIDLRVDDHQDPVRELLRVFERFDKEYLIRDDPLLPASPDLVAELQRALAVAGAYGGAATGELDDVTRDAVADLAARCNLEAKVRLDDQLYESLVREIREIAAAMSGEADPSA